MTEHIDLSTAHERMRAAYWERKDLGEAVHIARDAIKRGQQVAEQEPDPDRSGYLLGQVKGLAYDLGSFTWIGWDEPGIEIDESARAAGLDAARLNLALATKLGRGPDRMAAAHWLLGGQLLAAGDRVAAADAFRTAAAGAEQADEAGLRLLSRGFAALARSDRSELDAVRAELAEVPDGPLYVDQLDTADRVFGAG